MKSLLARWDVTADEQARLSFGQVLTTVNLRRVEIACIVGLFTRLIEMASGFRSPSAGFEIPFLLVMLIASEGLRRRNVSPGWRGVSWLCSWSSPCSARSGPLRPWAPTDG